MVQDAPAPRGNDLATDWFSPRRFAILLALLICAAFPDVITGSGTFFHRDFSLFGYPLAAYHREFFWRGEMPLWTPLNYLGLPFLAQWNTLTLYPLSLIYLLLPLSWSLGLFTLVHLYLGGLGMYFLAYRWTDHRFAAAVAGLAFTFNAVMLHFLMWPNNMAGMAWMPWVVLAMQRAWREGSRRILVAALVGALQMLSGAPEIILLTWLFLGILWLTEFLRRDAAHATLIFRSAIVVAFIATLCAVQLLPFLDLLKHSQRDSGFSETSWAMPLWGWANYLVPLFRVIPTPAGVYAQPYQYWIFGYYLGAGIAALALLAACQSRQLRKPFLLLSILTGICLLLALGERGYVYSAFRHIIPGLSLMRFPAKFVILPTFLIPLLAAGIVAHILTTPQNLWSVLRRRIAIALGVALILIGVIVGIAFQFPMKAISAPLAATSGVTRALFIVAIFSALIFLKQTNHDRFKTPLKLGVLFLVWLDMMTSGPRPNPTVPQWVYQPGLVRKETNLTPPPQTGQSRVLLSIEAEDKLSSSTLTNAAEQVVFTRLGLQADANLLDDIPIVAGMYSLYIREIGDVLAVLYQSNEPPTPLADFLAISHINAPGKITERLARPSHLPWVTAGQKPIFSAATNTLIALGQTNFNPREVVYLPLDTQALVTVTNASTPALSVRQFSAHHAAIDVDASQPALVVIAQTYYHNWRAQIDGQPAPLLRANHAFQAVQVPAGKHTVTLKYVDRAFQFGAAVSLLSLGAWLVLWIRSRPRSS